MDNRRYNRLAFRVLDHDPTHDDVRAFLAEFKGQLDERGLKVRGITTDGSSLYPKVFEELWPGVPHQVCELHVIKEITKAVLHALAKLRKEITAKVPKLPRGRPSKEQQGHTRKVARQKRRVAELFEHRHLFVRHHLGAAQRKLLRKLTRGLPQLRALRAIMEEVYRLFDRRCKAQTALKKLARLRRRVGRFKKLGKSLNKLESPTLEKALVFLDDKLLGRRATRWRDRTGASARRRRVSTASGRKNMWNSAWRWTCTGSSAPRNASRPIKRSIVPARSLLHCTNLATVSSLIVRPGE